MLFFFNPQINYVIDTVYIYSWKTIDKILTHFGDATYQKWDFFLAARGAQLDNGVTPLWLDGKRTS